MANEVERERERERAFLDRQVELDKTLKRIQEREKRIQEQEKRIQEREEEYRLYRIRRKRNQKLLLPLELLLYGVIIFYLTPYMPRAIEDIKEVIFSIF
jgi:uncharacterized membrane protein (DUF106 family)